MSLLGFCEWLATTSGSVALHSSIYVYSIVSTIHVVSLALFVGTAAMISLRLVGATLRRVSVSEVVARLRPWTTAGFLLMLASGALLFYANPVPRYQSLFFRIKMAMIVLAGVNVWVFQRTAFRSVTEWDRDPVPPLIARVTGGVALVLWAAIITSGRMIAYDWFDCRRQPQSAIVNVLAGCVTDPR